MRSGETLRRIPLGILRFGGAAVAQPVERHLGKVEVLGSNPSSSFVNSPATPNPWGWPARTYMGRVSTLER